MKNIYLFILILISSVLSAQKTSYFDNIFRTEYSTQTPYKREYQRIKDTLYFQDFYKDSLQLKKGKVWGLTNKIAMDEYIFYISHRALDIYYKPYFESAKLHYTSFKLLNKDSIYKGSRVLAEISAEKNNIKYSQVYDEAEKPQLSNGSGFVSELNEAKNSIYYSKYQDSILIESYTVRITHNDTIYNLFDKMAEPKKGLAHFYKELISKVKLPKNIKPMEYLTHIEFIVNQNGMLTEFQSLKKQPNQLDANVIKYLKSVERWKPATFNGKNVSTHFHLPVRFIIQ